ncbi:transglycosylase SLT domain-containing protein [Xanthobacter sp. TB0139]|uniref:transglycosylase SLT domain-containing protein n=1 Tax=Xanthobacter sp. TB0139 TaxID=3459178 RepID=UPI00403923D8
MAQQAPAQAEKPENFDHAICRLIDDAAASNGLPNAFLTRLIWRESSFRPHVVSHAGAQGIAQFMPATAKARGLENPFDPATAIPASAALLADHMRQFGNLGLAAAAYNAGPGRVSGFLAGGGLPMETRNYVRFITGRSAEQWAELKQGARISLATDEESGVKPSLPKDSSPTKTPEEAPETPEEADPSGVTLFPPEPCLTTLASLRKGMPAPEGEVNPLFAPWGVQISGNFNRATALASFRRTAARHRNVMGELTPVIVATRMGGRGRRVFYRVRLPAETRREANALCNRLRKAGGACIVLPN